MALTTHTLHAATLCPALAPLMGPRFPRTMTCRCWLIETDAGLVLVDTGFGANELSERRGLDLVGRISGVDPARTRPILEQLPALGYRASDVRHIIATHLDFDHAGGVPDFPHATVHCLAAEHARATGQKTLIDRMRYRSAHLRGHERWALYEPEEGGERWFGFEAVRQLQGLPDGVLLVPLPGHTRGHTCVAVETPHGWQMHAGDAYFASAQLRAPEEASRGLERMRRVINVDHALANRNLERLRELERSAACVQICCAHDPDESD